MNIIIDVTLLNQMNPDVGYRAFFGYLELSITMFD